MGSNMENALTVPLKENSKGKNAVVQKDFNATKGLLFSPLHTCIRNTKEIQKKIARLCTVGGKWAGLGIKMAGLERKGSGRG
jgi:hypothetical protein